MRTAVPLETEAFLIVDARRCIDCVDRAARSVLNLEPSDVLGAPCHRTLALLHADGQPFCSATCPVRSELARGAAHVEHHRLRYRNGGGEFEVCLRAVPLFRPSDGGMAILHILVRSSHCRAPHAGPINLGRLTRREREVLALLAEGRTTAEISEFLFITPATVRHHVQHILEKLEVHRRLHAVVAWMEAPPAGEDLGARST
jgi:DNA-binding CsgD family transcriptional regulator